MSHKGREANFTRVGRWLWAFAGLAGLAGACGTSQPGPSPTPTVAAEREQETASWVYWLQDIDLDQLGPRTEGLLGIDYSGDGTDDGAFTRDQILALKNSSGGNKTVLAYMSIGEAEEYRSYWQPRWRPGSPQWLEQENPAWAGNFKVHYWDPEWQRVIFGTPDSYLDKILAAGFDGTYLDIIDAYDYFQKGGRESAEAEMVEFVRTISAYAKARNPDFLIVPQNAPELGGHPAYLEVVDGVAQEGLYYGYEAENEATSPEVTQEIEGYLDVFLEAGKLVLVVDYASSPEKVRDAYRRSQAKGYRATVTYVDLDRLPLVP